MSFVDSKSYRRWSRLLTGRRRDNRASFSRYRTPRSLRHRGMCVRRHLLIIIIIILDPIFSIQVRAYSSRKSWRLQFHNSELHFRTRPPNLTRERLRTYSNAFLSCCNALTPCFCTTLCQLTCRTYDSPTF